MLFTGFLKSVDIFKKIQNQPENIRKLILWAAVIFIGSALFFFWIKSFQERLAELEMEKFKEELNLPKLEMLEIEIPEFEMPEISEEELKELEETMN